MTWHTKIENALNQGNYDQVVNFYEQAIALSPENITNYWYLGLAYLLQEKEEDAQSIWFSIIAQGDETEIEQWSQELTEILIAEATHQEELHNYDKAWLIRGHIREIEPLLLDNLLKLIQLAINLKIYAPNLLSEWQIIELLQSTLKENINQQLLLSVLAKVLQFTSPESVAFAEVVRHKIDAQNTFVNILLSIASRKGNVDKEFDYAIQLINLCLKIQPENLTLWQNLFWLYIYSELYEEAENVGKNFSDKCQSLSMELVGSYQLLYLYLKIGDWQQISQQSEIHINLINQIIEQDKPELDLFVGKTLILYGQPLLYLRDTPLENRHLQNHLAQIFQSYLTENTSKNITHKQVKTQKKSLKIGYIGHTLNMHSVGWLSRWLFHYHNREEFKIAVYLLSQLEDSLTEKWFKKNADISHNFALRNFNENADKGQNEFDLTREVVEQIKQDEIDILVDLDSLSKLTTCQIMAFKPAPIQVTWLGMDASGLPAIDYFIADPYVLPENAQEYYQEKIWRLPQTYLAVDGFEIGVPTVTKRSLDIPHDAITYLNIQGSHKRNLETIRLQMKIIKAVDNSYFLIKGSGDEEITKKLYTQVAESLGISSERLRFLPFDDTEATHRANLSVADVVLDTYPYNGATTTLEVLWVGIPLVTRVGEQFAARNSYTFMVNAGINEGIAYTDEEYLEWGIKLGKDEDLRREITWKLRQSRQTSPLWNGKQFTREMERAYRQMWVNYLSF